MKPLKIVVTGAESSGKTTLSRQLSLQLDCPVVSEYARTFFEKKNTITYVYEDLLKIAQGQIRLETKIFKKNLHSKLFILDTDLITIKIWSMVKFGRCDNWILNQIEERKYDFYGLCSPKGITWEADPLRENPMNRQYLFELYEKELLFYQKKYIILTGSEAARQNALLQNFNLDELDCK